MAGIVYDAAKVKSCEACYSICKYAEFDQAWADRLWEDIVLNPPVYEEFVYYIENHTFRDRFKIIGYSLSDLYVWQMDKYNLIRDTGKNARTCNKEKMVMMSFRTILDMQKQPEVYRRRLEERPGMDKM